MSLESRLTHCGPTYRIYRLSRQHGRKLNEARQGFRPSTALGPGGSALCKGSTAREVETPSRPHTTPTVTVNIQTSTHPSFEDIKCLSDSHSLSEVSLDGNPLAQDPHYKQTMLRHMQQLRQLDMKRISEDERRIATVMARKEEEKKRESNKVAIMKEKRRLAINNARRQWETMQGAVRARTGRLLHAHSQHSTMPDLVASHVATVRSENPSNDDSRPSSRQGRPASAKSTMSETDVGLISLSRPPSGRRAGAASPNSRGTTPTPTPTPTPDTDKSLRGTSSGSSLNANFLSELEGDTLSLYGPGALDALDKNWGIQAAGAVNTIIFRFIDFDEIVKQLHKVRVRFPNVHTVELHSTNLHHMNQLNALSSLRRLDNLVVDPEANPVTSHALWKVYTLFRLAHFCLKTINHKEVGGKRLTQQTGGILPMQTALGECLCVSWAAQGR